MNLTRQITIILAVFITIASITAIVPAYLIIRGELTAQLNQRLQDARQHSQTILKFEQHELESTITLAAERPTLERLLREQAVDELNPYLAVFQNNTALDHLYVTDLSGNYLAGTKTAANVMSMSFTHPVSDVGYVTGTVVLDDEFTQRLQEQTGFHFAFRTSDTASIADDSRYYSDTFSLQDLTDYPDAALVVMLPIGGLFVAEGEIIGLLLLTTLSVAMFASLGGGLYVRSRIRPLWRLTGAARQMGQGDLTTHIATVSHAPEIRTLADVLERTRVHLRHTLKDLSQAKEWSESLIQSVTEGIITLDAGGSIVFFSDGAAHITGINREDALNRNINTLLPTDSTDQLTDYIPLESGRRSAVVRIPGGQTMTLAITRARQTEEGQTTIVLHDITEETRHRSLQAYFLAHVSHEFRTPLAGMKVSIELLLENARYLSTAELQELLNSLYLSVSSLQNLIDNLLESSKIEASHFSLRRQPVHFNQVLSDALRLVQPFVNRRSQVLSLDQPLTLPELNADSTRLAQVLVNLVSNASKYSPMHSPIEILIDERGHWLYVAVADRGAGIPKEQRDSVFRQFVRLGGETSSEYSSGLGLAVVKAIIEAHGGQTGVDAREGGGSIFWFTLPR